MNQLISDTAILWLLPIIFMIHDFEEIIPTPGWVQRNKEQIYNKIPGFAKSRVENVLPYGVTILSGGGSAVCPIFGRSIPSL